MATKKLPKFEVKYFVRGIVSITIKAPNEQIARERAEKRAVQKGFFAKDVEYIDGFDRFSGLDSLADWDEIKY